ncbi:hypothetical protein [Streptomyces zingiberis]|uniref:Uncharacterized protein n=1 Tax=Streptomyces zingiberis TaxID=2053010 RepID=A0ABX1BXX9_9ACTN|nr:hypothetical protein [Streptomyces zingiberis]NJQ02481.1 hypothetical protein [Streptomyces zingiberis]
MLDVHQEINVVVTAILPFGLKVDIDGMGGVIDQTKHPSWWDDVEPAEIGDLLHAVVLDPTRSPPRLSALRKDIETARRLRSQG